MKAKLYLSSSLSLMLLAAGPALAQDSGVGEGVSDVETADAYTDDLAAQQVPLNRGLDVIVVTAQKQSENLQQVPISVTALTGDTLQRQQVTNVSDLTTSIPNVQINQFSNSPDSAVFTIRGVGVNDADPYVGTTVSVVVDGVVVGVNTAALLSLFDIDRVEVLRGPQGTLFGANTTGGVINIVTEQPTGENGGEFQVVYGNYNQFEANGAFNFAITNELSGKISLLHNQNDGFFRSYNGNSRIGATNVTSVRGYLRYDTGNYDATVIGEYVRSRNDSQVGILQAEPGDLFYTPGETEEAFDYRRGLSRDQPNFNNRDTYSLTLTQNLDTSFGELTSITNYREYENNLFSDDDATSRVLLQTRRNTDHHQFSQELRNLVNVSDDLRLIAGLFYFEQGYTLDQAGKLDGFSPGLGQPQTQKQDNWSLSGFLQTYYDLTPSLTLQAGIRYSHEETKAVSTNANTQNPTGPATFDDPIIPGTFVRASGKASWDNVGYKIGLDYEVRPDLLLYGYYARGFKSGGFTGRINVAEDIGPFDPETLDTYEIGMKVDLLDSRLRINTAAFYNFYDDMQVVENFTDPNSGANIASITNVGKAETGGFEVEVTALPTDGLTLSGSVAYLYAEYKEYESAVGGTQVSYAGNRLSNSPKWTASAGINWAKPIANGTLNSNIQYNYSAPKFSNYTNLPSERIGHVHLVNAALSWGPDDGAWDIGVYGRNLFNEKYFNQKLALPGIGTLASVGNPRQYGLRANFRF